MTLLFELASPSDSMREEVEAKKAAKDCDGTGADARTKWNSV